MDKIIFIGGVGSNRHQMALVQRELELFYGRRVDTLSFREAQRSPDHTHRLVKDALVITHSAGVLMLKNTAPRHAIIIAPPMNTRPIILIMRMVNKTLTLLRGAQEVNSRREKIRDYHKAAFREHLQYPLYNSGAIRMISSFDALQMGIDLVYSGAKVTFGYMTRDILFPSPDEVLLRRAEHAGIHIRHVKGEHDELLFDTIAIMRVIEGE